MGIHGYSLSSGPAAALAELALGQQEQSLCEGLAEQN